MVVQGSEAALLREEVAIEGPEDKQREVGDRRVDGIRVLRCQGKECSDERDSPSLQEKQVARHAVDSRLQELKVLVFVAVLTHGY